MYRPPEIYQPPRKSLNPSAQKFLNTLPPKISQPPPQKKISQPHSKKISIQKNMLTIKFN